MAHDVFISYAGEDREVAEKVCRALEEQSVKCWMAPRDVPVGVSYELSILNAIEASQLLVLIFSAHANASQHVEREIRKAFEECSKTKVFPFHIENVPYNKVLYYYLGGAQWVDASSPPLESHLQRLVEDVRAHLRPPDGKLPTDPTEAAPMPVIPEPAEPTEAAPLTVKPPRPFPVAWLALGAGALLLLVAVAVSAYWLSGNSDLGAANSVNGNSNVIANNVINNNAAAPVTPTPPPPANVNAPMPTPRQTQTQMPMQMPTQMPTPAPPPPTPVTPSNDLDPQIESTLRTKLRGYAGLKSVECKVQNGTVVLWGNVPPGNCAKVAETLSSRIKGVVGVVNNIMMDLWGSQVDCR